MIMVINKKESTLSSNLQLRNIPRTVDFILMTLNRDQTKRGDKTNKAHTKNVPVLFVSVECYSSVHFFQSYECVWVCDVKTDIFKLGFHEWWNRTLRTPQPRLLREVEEEEMPKIPSLQPRQNFASPIHVSKIVEREENTPKVMSTGRGFQTQRHQRIV